MSNQNKTRLRISTPHGLFYDGDVSIVTLRTSEGYIGLQYNRVPFISSVEISTLYIIEDLSQKEVKKTAAIDGGIVFVEKTYIDIFTDNIEWKEKINKTEVEKQIEIATSKLNSSKELSAVEKHKNELTLKKALNKLTTLDK